MSADVWHDDARGIWQSQESVVTRMSADDMRARAERWNREFGRTNWIAFACAAFFLAFFLLMLAINHTPVQRAGAAARDSRRDLRCGSWVPNRQSPVGRRPRDVRARLQDAAATPPRRRHGRGANHPDGHDGLRAAQQPGKLDGVDPPGCRAGGYGCDCLHVHHPTGEALSGAHRRTCPAGCRRLIERRVRVVGRKNDERDAAAHDLMRATRGTATVPALTRGTLAARLPAHRLRLGEPATAGVDDAASVFDCCRIAHKGLELLNGLFRLLSCVTR